MDAAQKAKILSELGGIPAEVYDELVLEFVAQTREQVKTALAAVQAGKAADAIAIMHSVKGCAANLRLVEVSDMAKSIEMALKSGGESAAISDSLDKLYAEVDRTRV